jgi:hypothetical protein
MVFAFNGDEYGVWSDLRTNGYIDLSVDFGVLSLKCNRLG